MSAEKKPTAAESAKWHRAQAYGTRTLANYRAKHLVPAKWIEDQAAHYEAAAEALELLAAIYRDHPGIDNILSDDHHARVVALLGGA